MGPGLDLLDVTDQVLPGQEAPHVQVQLVPEHEEVLVGGLQPAERQCERGDPMAERGDKDGAVEPTAWPRS